MKGVEARRRKAAMSPQERALDAISSKLGDLTRELLNAALGVGDFEELKPETRVAALKTLMEYGLGKPTAQAKVDPEADPEREPGPSPASLFARPNVDAAAVSERT
jgi:hypothetical protein